MIKSYIEEINSETNIIVEYFRLQAKYSAKYGKQTVVFMQVGSFHEAYATNTEGFKLSDLSDMLNIIVSKKNKSILEVSNANPYMIGFPSPVLDKFLRILINNNLTVVIVDQITCPPKPKRAITGIYSPATYIEDTSSHDANNILSIYIEEIESDHILSKNNLTKSNLIIGLSIIDLSTGKSSVHEIYSSLEDEKYCLDETVRFMYSNSAKEIIITTNNLKENKLSDILSYLEITDKIYHHQTICQMINSGKKSLFKLSYQQEIFRKVYGNTGLLSPIEFLDLEHLTYARLSFIILLNYAYDHSHQIINRLAKPDLFSDSKYLNLGNNALFQLNLITFDRTNQLSTYAQSTQFKSLFDVLDKTSTPMGRRLLKQNLAQPLVNSSEIQIRYDFINMLRNLGQIKQIEQLLSNISDIERYNRRMILGTLNPTDLYIWIRSMGESAELFNYMIKNNIILPNYNMTNLTKNLNLLLSKFSKCFDIEELPKYFINDINGPIFNPNINSNIDKLLERISKCSNYMNAISWGLSNFLDNYLKTSTSTKSSTDSLIKIDSNDRDGHFLILTKRRADVLEQLLKERKQIKFTYSNITYELNLSDIEFKHLPKGNTTKIFIKEMGHNSVRMLELEDELKYVQKEFYVDFLLNITTKYSDIIEQTQKLVAMIDFLKSGAKVGEKYHYVCPQIKKLKSNESKSYFKAIELRHPIIELLNTSVEYVPTNIELGTNLMDGMLLFGLNSAGKSSLQKATGIAVIMAQMGYPVAATEFIYYPYKSIFTRISSNDNLFKGLSSFALEISELRSIIKRSTSNTLVIADEVCHSTEHKSSLIIVMTMLEILSANKVSLITATHLHDIINVSRLKKLTNIKLYHLHVDYDESSNIVKYDRTLREGSGCNFYGLNIAKYLIADTGFVKLSNEIKKEIMNVPDLVVNKLSNYNSNLYMDKCTICNFQPIPGEIPLETHHIVFQKDFTNNISKSKFYLQKNSKSNLVVLCTKCHDQIDAGIIHINKWIKTNNGDILDWSYVNQSTNQSTNK